MIENKSGFDTVKTTTGTKKTVVGFQPKLLFVSLVPDTAVGGINTHYTTSVGIGTLTGSPTNQICLTNWDMDGTLLDNKNYHKTEEKLMRMMANETTSLIEGLLVSFDADGFTIDYTVVDGNAYRFAYLAIGGDDIEQTYIGKRSQLLGVMPPYVTDIDLLAPFDPDFVLFTTDWVNNEYGNTGLNWNFAGFFNRRDHYINGEYGAWDQSIGQVRAGARSAGKVNCTLVNGNPMWSYVYFPGTPYNPNLNMNSATDGYITNGIRISSYYGNMLSPINIYYIAIKGAVEITHVYAGIYGGWSNTWNITLPHVAKPACAFVHGACYGGDGALPTIPNYLDASIGFIDEVGNQAGTTSWINPPATAPVATISKHSNFNDSIWEMRRVRDNSVRLKYNFVSWGQGVEDGKLTVNKMVWTTPYSNSGAVFSLLTFGHSQSDPQMVGQGGTVV